MTAPVETKPDRRRALLRGVDHAAFAASLGERLRSAGVGVDLDAVTTLAEGMAVAVPRFRDELYWLCRITLITRFDDIALFDQVFAAIFDDAVLATDPNARRKPLFGTTGKAPIVHRDGQDPHQHKGAPRGRTPARSPQVTATGGAPDRDATPVPLLLPSDASQLAGKSFSDFDDADLDLLERSLKQAAPDWPRRRTRRVRIGRSGRSISLRATMARSRRHGFEPVSLMMTRQRYRPRRTVMICDVSASMQAHAAAYLHLMRALVRTTDAEVFAFATRLTRLTPALSHRAPSAAVSAATAAVDDRFGGTRIGDNLAELLSGPYGELLRGANVIVASDGWEAGDCSILAAAMARLHRRAYRVLWINPRASAPGFEPMVAGMSAALPFCDSMLAGETIEDLLRVAEHLCAAAPDR